MNKVQSGQKEADIIVTAVLFGYILWRTTLKQAVTIAPPSDKEDGKIVDKLNALMSSADTTTDEEEQEAQIVGYIHGACLCLLARELLPNLLELGVSEYSHSNKAPVDACCLPCATYLSAQGIHPAQIHLDSAQSWVPPSINDKPGSKQGIGTYLLQGLSPAIFQTELFKSFVKEWLIAGLPILKRQKLGPRGRTLGSKKIIPLLGKQVGNSSLLFLDALTMRNAPIQSIGQLLAHSKSKNVKT